MKKIRKAVLPVAGLGTRYLPATKAVPKEMIPVVDVPMIQLIVEEAVQAGIEDIIFVTARGKTSLEDHFDYAFELDHTLKSRGKEGLLRTSHRVSELCNVISIRQKNPRGLGHAVLTAAPIVGEEPFAVLLGDEVFVSEKPCIGQLVETSQKTGLSSVATMAVPQNEVSKYGIVGGEKKDARTMKVDHVIEKPDPTDAPSNLAIPGRYVLDAKVFDYLRNTKPGKGGEIQLTDGLTELARNEGLLGYEVQAERYDTGDRIGFLDATLAFALRREDLKEDVKKLIKKYSDSL